MKTIILVLVILLNNSLLAQDDNCMQESISFAKRLEKVTQDYYQGFPPSDKSHLLSSNKVASDYIEETILVSLGHCNEDEQCWNNVYTLKYYRNFEYNYCQLQSFTFHRQQL